MFLCQDHNSIKNNTIKRKQPTETDPAVKKSVVPEDAKFTILARFMADSEDDDDDVDLVDAEVLLLLLIALDGDTVGGTVRTGHSKSSGGSVDNVQT